MGRGVGMKGYRLDAHGVRARVLETMLTDFGRRRAVVGPLYRGGSARLSPCFRSPAQQQGRRRYSKPGSPLLFIPRYALLRDALGTNGWAQGPANSPAHCALTVFALYSPSPGRAGPRPAVYRVPLRDRRVAAPVGRPVAAAAPPKAGGHGPPYLTCRRMLRATRRDAFTQYFPPGARTEVGGTALPPVMVLSTCISLPGKT